MPIPDKALVMMTKMPVPGASKTRLVPPLSYEEAADLAGAMIEDQLRNLSCFNDARLFLTYTPSSSADFFVALHPGEWSFPQVGTDRGDRMLHAFEHLFNLHYRRVVLIGSDLPALPPGTLRSAFVSLADNAEVVFGPSLDGGYYLIGMTRVVEEIFSGIQW